MSVPYKLRNMRQWDEVAGRYHRRMLKKTGPSESSAHLVRMMRLDMGQRVLDVACGTGAVTRLLGERVGIDGMVVGTDTSISAIRIARRFCGGGNTHFVNADAEALGFGPGFDAVTCQFALFFFPDAGAALANMRAVMHGSGRLGITVHGSNTPFYSGIIDVITEFIPDYIITDVKLDRYDTAPALRAEVAAAGFRQVRVHDYTFEFCAGGFEKYWRDYTRYISKPLKEKLKRLTASQRRRLVKRIRDEASAYMDDDGMLVFPWQVLISTARV